jgi:hypothetical protein
MTKATDSQDQQKIRDIIENWVIWRDTGMWRQFRTLWHDDGRMMATWFQGPVDEFIKRGSATFDRGGGGGHFLGGSAIEISGKRAIGQTKMHIMLREAVDGVVCDVVCTGRFYDFLEKRRGRWGLVLRQPIYEKDRLDPVVPGQIPNLDKTLLKQFPVGYQHLAYAQTRVGLTIKRDMPGARGPELAALYARGEAWLKGKKLS